MPGGRPKKQIKKATFEKLCALQCTEEEICDVLEVSQKTLARWCAETYDGLRFSQVFAQKKSKGKVSLRRMQWKLAESSASVSIWLGKQYLQQSDNGLLSAKDAATNILQAIAAATREDVDTDGLCELQPPPDDSGDVVEPPEI